MSLSLGEARDIGVKDAGVKDLGFVLQIKDPVRFPREAQALSADVHPQHNPL